MAVNSTTTPPTIMSVLGILGGIFTLVGFFLGWGAQYVSASTFAVYKEAIAQRLDRMEGKLDLLLEAEGVKYEPVVQRKEAVFRKNPN